MARLETQVTEQQLILDSVVPNKRDDAPQPPGEVVSSVSARTCSDLRSQNPGSESGWYWIDPDGPGFGDHPIYAHCNMTSASIPTTVKFINRNKS